MPDFEKIFRDPDFRSLPTERQRSILSEIDDDYAGLDVDAQDRTLSEGLQAHTRGTDYLGELKRGAQAAHAHIQHIAANAADLAGFAADAQRIRNESKELALEATPPQDRYTTEYVAYVFGGLPESLAAAAGFVEAAAMAVPAWAAAPIGFGAMGALGAADQGPAAAAQAGAREFAFGALFPATQHMRRAIRGPAIGGAAYALGAGGDQPTDQRLVDAATMGVLAGLPGSRPIVDPLRKLGFRDRAMERAIEEGKVPAEKAAQAMDEAGQELLATELQRDALRTELFGDGAPKGNVTLYDHRGREIQLPRKGESAKGETRGSPEEGTLARERPVEGEPLETSYDMNHEIARRGGAERPDYRKSVDEARETPPSEASRLLIAKEDVRPDIHGIFPDDLIVDAGNIASPIPGKNNPGIQDVRFSTKLPKKLVRHGDIMVKLAKALGIPIKGGRIPGLKFEQRAGIAGRTTVGATPGHPWKGSLRIRDHKDLETAAHEMGHALDFFNGVGELMHRHPDAMRFLNAREPFRMGDLPPWLRELYSLSYSLDARRVGPEGFAELTRMWFTNRKYLEERTPNALKRFEEALENKLTSKQMKEVRKVQREMHNFFDQGGRAGIRASIGPYDSPASVLWSKADDLRAKGFDDFHGVRAALEKMGIPIDGSVYETFRRLRGIARMTEGMIQNGAPKWVADPKIPGRKFIRYDGKSLEKALRPVLKKGWKELEAWFDYAIARQAKELKRQMIDPKTGEIRQATRREMALNVTREKLFSEKMIESGMALETPMRKKVFEDVMDFQKRVADFAEETGLFSASQRAGWKRLEYAFGFFRDLKLAQIGAQRSRDRLASAVGVHRLHGSTRNLKDPFDNLINGPSRLVQAALENKARLDLVDAMKKANAHDGLPGRFIEEIPATHQRVTIGKLQLESAMIDELMRVYGMTRGEARKAVNTMFPPDIERLAVFLGGSKPFGDNIMTVFRNGRKEYYEIADEGLERALAAMRRPLQATAVRWMNSARRWKQNFITMDPSFMAANFARDVAMASIMSKTGNFHLWKALGGLVSIWRNDQAYRDFLANGGGGAAIRESPVALKRRMINHAQRWNWRGLNPERLLHGPADMWRFLDRVGRAVENASRVGEFKAASRRGVKRRSFQRRQDVSVEEAAFLGREVSTDFSMRGDAGGILNFATHTVPFFNAMLAGADRGYRAAFRDPYGRVRAAGKMGAVALSSALLYGINKELAAAYGREAGVDFDDLPDWTKTAYWHIYIPTEWNEETGLPSKFQPFTMPRLWEVGAVASVADRFVEHMMNSEDEELGKDLITIVANSFNINTHRGFPVPLPVGVDLVAEQFSNTILFTGAPIETAGMEGKPPYLRARSTQTQAIKDYGKAVRNIPFPVFEQLKSPARAEALLRGIFGEWASMGLHLADFTMNPDGPELHNSRLPIIRRFYREVGKYDKNTTDFYDRLAEFSREYNALKHLQKQGENEIVKEMMADPRTRAEVAMRRPFDRANRRVQLFNREIAAIREGVTMRNHTPRQKREAIDALIKERNAMMRMMNEIAKSQVRRAEGR